MRKIYWAIAFLYLPFQMGAQDGVAWHNQGPASSTSGAGDKISLHIGGHLKFSNQAGSTQTPEMSIADSRIRLTGNFINDVDRGDSGGTLFKAGTGGIFEFCGTTPQAITTSGADITDIPSKLTNFIDFPKLEINNNKHVTLDARLAAQTQDVDLTKGWLILDSQKAEKGVDGATNDVDDVNESVLAHLLVEGQVNYNMASWTVGQNINDRGFIQVNLRLENEGALTEKSIVGFGSPFQETYVDYFMYNTLLEPAPAGFLSKPPITDPKRALLAGRGHVVGIDLKGNAVEDYLMQPAYEDRISFAQRAKDGYEFNRSLFYQNKPENEVFDDNISSPAYTKEMLNTSDITIPLEAGYNYLSNPYTCPLNIDKLLGNDEAGSTWNVRCDEWSNSPEVRNRVWVLNTNSRAKKNVNDNTTHYIYNYQVAMRIGGTYIGDYEEDDNVPGITPIAPLQMFMVYAHSSAESITIPRKERKMATTRFLRNAPATSKRKDDFIVEFRNRQTQTTDRLSFVLRTNEELKTSNSYNNVNRMAGNAGDTNKSALVYDGITQNHGSQIYTKDPQNKPLTVQFLPLETTDYIQLYHIAPLEQQDLQVLGRRIATKDRIENMWLEDKLYNTTTEITPDMVYETVSKPNDPVDRFIIRLKNGTSLENETETQRIYAYTKEGNIVVQGFVPQDYGKRVELYDLNGRLLANGIANESSLILYRDYQQGVYLIKVNTGKTQVIKLIAH